MGQRTLSGADISALREEYLRKITTELPAKADNTWSITHDHCFARVVLDNIFECKWSEEITESPAYMHLSEAQLQAGIEIADRMLADGKPTVEELNQRSLHWRQSN